MGLVFLLLVAVMLIWTQRAPLDQPRSMPRAEIDLEPHPHRYWLGGAVLASTAVLYAVFW